MNKKAIKNSNIKKMNVLTRSALIKVLGGTDGTTKKTRPNLSEITSTSAVD